MLDFKDKKTIIGAIVVLAAGAILYRTMPKETKKAAPAPAFVQVAAVERVAALEQKIGTTTALTANADVVLKSKVESHVQKICVAEGQRVEAGTLLVELEHTAQKATVDAMSANIEMSSAAAEAARASMENAATERSRYDKLIEHGYITQEEADTRRTKHSMSQSEYEKALATIEHARAELAVAKATLKDYFITAPFSGVVLDDYDKKVGNKVNEDTDVLRIADIETMKACVNLQESDMRYIKQGMEAIVKCDSLPGEEFRGKVVSVSPFIDTATHTFKVDVALDNKAIDYKLKPGMFARVYLITEALVNPLVIPKSAVREDGSVLIVKDNKVRVANVIYGLEADGKVVVAEGLQDKDVVVISGGKKLKDGEAVEIQKN